MKTPVSTLLTTGLLFFCMTNIAGADTFRVDRFDDSATSTNCSVFFADDCSLRGAIIKANQDPDFDEIYLPAGTYIITIPGMLEDASATGDLDITEETRIQGDPNGVLIYGNNLDRVFHVLLPGSGDNVFFSNLTIKGGDAEDTGGGGILVEQGILNPEDCTISENSSDLNGGGIYILSGHVFAQRTVISNNEAVTNAGGVFVTFGASLALWDSTVNGNVASNGAGGGIYINGSANLRRTSVWANHTYYVSGTHSRGGGGIYNVGSIDLNNCSMFINWAHNDPGGAIYNGDILTMTHVSISGNISSPATSTAIHNAAGADLTTVNSLFAGKCHNDGGSITSTGYNLESPGNTCLLTGPIDQVDVADAMTTIIDVAGGSRKCIALEEGSPAIDMASTASCTATDQRKSVSRPVDGDGNGYIYCDIGAYEYLGEYIFTDGFENGDMQTWSASVP